MAQERSLLNDMEKTIWQRIEENQQYLINANRDWVKLGEERQRAEMEYQIAKSKAVFRLRNNGYSNVLINLAIKGLPEIAELNFKRGLADDMYHAKLEDINIHKKIADDLREIYSKEWSETRND